MIIPMDKYKSGINTVREKLANSEFELVNEHLKLWKITPEQIKSKEYKLELELNTSSQQTNKCIKVIEVSSGKLIGTFRYQIDYSSKDKITLRIL